MAEVEQLLYYLQNRKEKTATPKPGSAGSSHADEDNGQIRIGSASLHRYSPIEDTSEFAGEMANINNIDEYIELLYEEVHAAEVAVDGDLDHLRSGRDQIELLGKLVAEVVVDLAGVLR